MANLYLMCGCPGSGKTTYCKNHLTEKDKHISRDEIRFSMLQPGENYFAHEDDVYMTFWQNIIEALRNGYNVFADQTNLSIKSRHYLLGHIPKGACEHIYAIVIKNDLQTCLNQNENRKGTKAYVPVSQLRRMFYSFQMPTKEEGFDEVFIYTPKREVSNG